MAKDKLTQLANYEHGKIKICTKPDVVSFTATHWNVTQRPS